MTILTYADIKRLLSHQVDPSVSIYLPTHRKGKEIEQDPIRLKNLLKQAEELLARNGRKGQEIEQMLAPARKLLDNSAFWRHQSDGLAIFIGGDHFFTYRLPINFDEVVVVSDRFYLKPLLSLVSGDKRFYLLVFSQKGIRLLQGSNFSMSEVDLKNIPSGLAETVDPDRYRTQLQYHTGAPARAGKRDAVFHGSGGGGPDNKDNILKYFRQIDQGLRELLHNESAPLVLAGVDYLMPIFREATKYPHLLDENISGNQDETSLEELHRQAWAIIEPYFKRDQKKAHTRLAELLESGKQSSAEIEKIVPAAVNGRIDLLFVGQHLYCWGSYDRESESVTVHDREKIGNQDLFDLAAVSTLAAGGAVYVVDRDDVPGDGPIAAAFRY
jgi:hypothetical protein